MTSSRTRLAAVVWVGPLGNLAVAADPGFARLLADYAAFGEKPALLALPPGVDTRYSKRLEDVSEDRFRKEAEALSGFAARLGAIGSGSLDHAETLDALILERQLRDRREELRLRGFEIPIGSREGFHFSMSTLADRYAFDRVEHYDEYVAKLQSFREHARQRIAAMRIGLASGRTLPRDVLQGYEQTIAPHVGRRRGARGSPGRSPSSWSSCEGILASTLPRPTPT
jgi:uncharacterized protein (DUF885 family)